MSLDTETYFDHAMHAEMQPFSNTLSPMSSFPYAESAGAFDQVANNMLLPPLGEPNLIGNEYQHPSQQLTSLPSASLLHQLRQEAQQLQSIVSVVLQGFSAQMEQFQQAAQHSQNVKQFVSSWNQMGLPIRESAGTKPNQRTKKRSSVDLSVAELGHELIPAATDEKLYHAMLQLILETAFDTVQNSQCCTFTWVPKTDPKSEHTDHDHVTLIHRTVVYHLLTHRKELGIYNVNRWTAGKIWNMLTTTIKSNMKLVSLPSSFLKKKLHHAAFSGITPEDVIPVQTLSLFSELARFEAQYVNVPRPMKSYSWKYVLKHLKKLAPVSIISLEKIKPSQQAIWGMRFSKERLESPSHQFVMKQLSSLQDRKHSNISDTKHLHFHVGQFCPAEKFPVRSFSEEFAAFHRGYSNNKSKDQHNKKRRRGAFEAWRQDDIPKDQNEPNKRLKTRDLT